MWNNILNLDQNCPKTMLQPIELELNMRKGIFVVIYAYNMTEAF